MKLKRIIVIIVALMLWGILSVKVEATSISFSNNNPSIGENITITVSISDVNTATVYANVSGPGINTKISVVNGDMTGNKQTFSNSTTVTPTGSGNITVSITQDSTAIRDGAYVSDVITSKTISVSAPAQTPTSPTAPTTPTTPAKSSNANLSNLGIRPTEYDFKGFRASKTSYEVTVPNEVNSVEIYANKQDNKASITGTGQKTLQEGTNVFKVVVTAEDGTQKTYQVNVVRKVAGAEVTPNIASDTSDTTASGSTIGLSKLEVKGMKLSPEFSTDVYRYIVLLEDEEISGLEKVKELINAEVNFEGGTFEIIGEEEFNKDENEVIVSVKDADGREIAIYTIVFKYKVKEDTSDSTNIIGETIENEYKLEKEKIIVIASIVIISIIAFVSSISSYKQRKILKENGLIKIKEKKEKENNDNKEDDEKEENNNIEEIKEKEENKDYINDIFENKQMQFEPNDNDFIKRKNKKGKHSQD